MFRSGWRTTEFWLSLLTTVGSLGGVVAGLVPGQAGAIVATVSSAAYAIARGLAKQTQPAP